MLVPSVIDLAPLLAPGGAAEDLGDTGRSPQAEATVAELHRACIETGFFVVDGHGIDAELVAVFAAARRFFEQPQAVKERVPRVERYGFIPHSGTAIDMARASDRTEYLDLGLHDEIALHELGFGELAEAVLAYQAEVLPIGRCILAALALALDLDQGYFAGHMMDPQCRLRFLHYPPVEPGPDGTLPVPNAAHTDYGLITLLATDGVSGLEVEPIGAGWTPVAAEANQLVVNLGDMMARWTNDVYRSTPHRVVGPAAGDRISIPFFVNPDPAAVVETMASCISAERPRRYEPVTAGEFLIRRIDGRHGPDIDLDLGRATEGEERCG